MIIREYREITKKPENLPEVVQAEIHVIDLLHRFDRFHLRENSLRTLKSFFHYLLEHESSEIEISYNFMIHCFDII